MTLRGRFIPDQALALFLDVDGTLLEIAPTPDAVRVPASLRNTLQLRAEREQGALALVSGRTLATLDQLFAPCVFPAAGQHGAERRDAQGKVYRASPDLDTLDNARRELRELSAQHKGLLLEDKGHGLALHYRHAPEMADELKQFMTTLSERCAPHFQLKPGKCVFELAPSGHSKRTAIEAFMREAPFKDRVPVFIGDDVTDEDGFAAVNELGGYAIRVGDLTHSQARYSFSNVAAVINWLRERNLSSTRFEHG